MKKTFGFYIFFSIVSQYVSAIEPVLPHICGTQWQLDYATKHDKALKGETTENKYIIDLPLRSGSADNLLGFISMFMWALLSDRVFIKYQSHRLPMIELAYEPATFNWLAHHNPIETRVQCITIVNENQTNLDIPCDTTPMKVLKTDTRESRPITYVAFGFNEEFYHDDLRKVPKDGYENELIFPVSSRGFMYQIFKNPHHNETLKSWGLKQETIFGCLFHYLLRPRDAVCKKDLEGINNSLSVILLLFVLL